MTDGPALLAAILANREDDTPRLAYADWLDENGEPERAEFIRVQVELAWRDPCHSPTECTGPITARKCPECDRWIEGEQLRRRERELQGPGNCNLGNWLKDCPLPAWSGGCDTSAGYSGSGWRVVDEYNVTKYFIHAHWARGFVGEIETDWDSWRTHADAITAAQPLERVTLTTQPDPTELRNRLRKMKGGAEKEERIGDDYIMNRSIRGYQTNHRGDQYDVYLRRLCEACWPKVAFEISAQTGLEAERQRELEFINGLFTYPAQTGPPEIRMPFTGIDNPDEPMHIGLAQSGPSDEV